MLGVDIFDALNQPDGPVAPSIQVTTTEDIPAENVPLDNIPVEAVLVDNGVELAVTGCGPEVVTGLLSADTNIDADVLQVTITVVTEDELDGEPIVLSRDILTPDPRSTTPLRITLPANSADVGCQVTGLTVNQ
jgi:hypothetical protein